MFTRITQKPNTQLIAALFLSFLAAGFLISPLKAQDGAAQTAPNMVLTGAGSMYPDVLFNETLLLFKKSNPDVQVKYEPIGSGAGVLALEEGKIEFAVSSAPLEAILTQDVDMDAEEEPVPLNGKLLEIPITVGMLGILYNIKGVGHLKLTQNGLAGIFDGAIKYWNNSEIQDANPDLRLPNLKITIIGRSDASGANYALSRHLLSAKGEWSGKAESIWPPATLPKDAILVPSSSEVVTKLREVNGAIGYAPSAFGSTLGIPMALIENKKGNFIGPSLYAGEAAIDEIAKSKDPLAIDEIPNPESPGAYPIVSLFWLVTNNVYSDTQTGKVVRDYAKFILSGQARGAAISSGYIPLPDNLRAQAKNLAGTIK
ncbi:Phosphate-binding protein PstS 2 precursor [Pseudovibrio axinellae]|uniref:Phosphate-binding protein PstS n=1 Tax=Pseudovibrio axinellae TaxID=989403 RepID=A0A166AD62_9HYPH|nr:extracellular solute-binding protein [Pseudovibrio axinellae]KZL20915.1 Phosphate-binding protein PstS 2 precursor [Pseudovibrio axinellae]SEQ65983.1 phosphate ABC transporter substrate-binding protein, PhoT family [Pseudovibrio axinellae]